ncbi:hypothetical protein [Actinomyces slackii]|uniref:hypothetical protein n=1 Tax=Actinomyces slackii TaxID=52774 RepID=UPI000F82EAE1|nr:hypothetical protein [Actinomyces slackii]
MSPVVGESPKVDPKRIEKLALFDCYTYATDGDFADASMRVEWGRIHDLASSVDGPFEGKRSLFGEDGVPFTIDGVEQGEGARTDNSSRRDTAAWRCDDEKSRGIVVDVYLNEEHAKDRDPAVDAVNLVKTVRPWACGERPVPNFTPTVTPSPGY